MKIYTKTGDGGETGLIGGARVAKCDLRVEAYGAVDETNAAMGLVATVCTVDEIRSGIVQIQDMLFTIGAELANPAPSAAAPAVNKEKIAVLEQWMDQATAELPELRHFVLPGGNETAARLHLARTTCRRAERVAVRCADEYKVDPRVLIYLNRLSDLLFVWARLANHRAGIADVLWIAPSETKDPP